MAAESVVEGEATRGKTDRAAEFIELFNRVDSHLRSLTGEDWNVTFAAVLESAATKSATIRNFKGALRDYGNLRNVIVHHRAYPREILAEPTQITIQRFRRLVGQVLGPPTVIPMFSTEVRVFEPTEPVMTALKLMRGRDFSQVVVRGPKGLSLLSVEGIARWLEASADQEIISLTEPTINAVLDFELPGSFAMMSRTDTIFDAREAFSRSIDQGRARIFAIIITHSGRLSEVPLGIITPWDLLRHNTE